MQVFATVIPKKLKTLRGDFPHRATADLAGAIHVSGSLGRAVEILATRSVYRSDRLPQFSSLVGQVNYFGAACHAVGIVPTPLDL
jgi:hypothetical protein